MGTLFLAKVVTIREPPGCTYNKVLQSPAVISEVVMLARVIWPGELEGRACTNCRERRRDVPAGLGVEFQVALLRVLDHLDGGIAV